MKVFLTGATGFIGAPLAERLASRGHAVVGLARDPMRAAPANVRLVRGDLAREDGLDQAQADLEATDVIAHLAAVRKDWGLDDATLHRINVASGPALLAAAQGARRFVLVSSVAVYGHSAPGTRTTERSPFSPSKRYGDTKVAAELKILDACRDRAVPCDIVRPGIVYGPGDTYGMVANLARLLARRRFLPVGAGTSRVQLLYIDDLVDTIARTVERDAREGDDFILAGPEPVEIRSLVEEVARAIPARLPPIRVPESAARAAAWALERAHRLTGRSGEPFLTRSKIDLFTRNDLYDTSKARAILGFAPRVGHREGIPRAVAWLKGRGWAH